MLSWSLAWEHGPVAVRVPAAGVVSRPGFERAASYERGWEVARAGADVAVLALGDLFPLGEKIADELAGRGVARATLVNPRRATAPEADLVTGLARDHRLVVTLEDGVVDGGFGERCARILAREGGVRVRCYGLPCAFPDRYDPASLLESCGMTVEGVCDDVERALGR